MFCLLQVLWKEIQALQVEQELDREFGHHGGAGGGGHQNHQGHHGGQGGQGYPDRRTEREKRRVTERKLGRLIGGAENRIYDDSDSSRGGCTVQVGRCHALYSNDKCDNESDKSDESDEATDHTEAPVMLSRLCQQLI